ncbi:ubiquitin carboxyl-terminal hydrolase 48-like [Strongylocentrotus purpuratus]|uniref:Ubiquitin carboxyl-terminal hydrolase 48 n=1 Tax=Strongylocentrotus purpuratus TaxID=7668 RepID=A0A7M7SX16_STRPU|nr:ubiquitin carboxyl-terminal hydrolase 48-like [Strongylocentrotus purpuratus]
MPSKSASDKEIWRWTETTSPDEVTEEHVRVAYRVNLPICSTSCRRNCKGNPNCLVNLGEKEWLKEIRDEHWYQMDDPEEEKRTKEDLVGLKNLGATCYVNTFLQVWFHNRQFREAIYKWRPLDKEWGKDQPLEDGVLAAIPDESLQPTSICGHLQLLFALLQFSKRRYIDPSNFINCLGLDAALQQDAQEFSKLLISLLEGTLKEQPNARVRNVIEQQFSGQYSYVTRCNHCGNCSERPSRFYELDLNIKGHKQLEDSLSEFLKEEKLEGANQYLCEKCNCKRNATRCIKLQTLPPVLNIQLLRFVFDRHSGTKKKLNNFLQFPEEIDMSKHLARRDNSAMYDLEAVLIHRGPTAYSGHYVAHIRSHGDGGVWFKFNDEEIQKMEGKNLKLGCEDELSAGKEGKRPKVPKGNHASKNAYMLVYKRRSTDQRESHVDNSSTVTSVESLPDYLQELIGRDNEKFEDWLREMVAMRTRNVESGRRMQQEIQTIYKQIHPEDDGRCDWIATEWLKKWLHEDETTGSKVGPINNYKFECKHKNLDPHKVKELKRISSKAADLLFAKYGSDGLQLRMTQSKMCLACVKQKCQVMRIQAQLVADQKFVTDNTKAKCQSEDGFWVGKDSLKQWKRMAVEKVESQFDGEGGATEGEEDMEIDDEDQALPNGKSSAAGAADGGENGAPPKENGEQKDEQDEEEEEEDEEPLVFNEDLLCPHGNLSTDMSQRRLVFAPVWEVLRKYFPESSEFKADSQHCLQCHLADAEDAEQAQQRCDLATEQKKSLSQLFHGRSRPAWKKGESMEVYVAPLPFVEAWRSFLRHPVKADLPTDIVNSSFICAHNGLILDPSTISPIDETSGVALVWPYEWEILKANFIVDQPIRIWKVIADEPCFITEPDLCQTCSQERQLAEHQARFTYSGVKLYIRKYMPEVGENAKAAINFLMEATSPGGSSDQENKDPDFQQNDPKRMKLELDNSSSSRRSSRHRRVRGEKEVMVSSTNTLKELKIKVMHAFSVAPFDQTLLFRGKPLQDNEATLSHLGVTPEALITLIVDSPICEDPLAMDEIARASSVPEAGFKGTGLQSS